MTLKQHFSQDVADENLYFSKGQPDFRGTRETEWRSWVRKKINDKEEQKKPGTFPWTRVIELQKNNCKLQERLCYISWTQTKWQRHRVSSREQRDVLKCLSVILEILTELLWFEVSLQFPCPYFPISAVFYCFILFQKSYSVLLVYTFPDFHFLFYDKSFKIT